MSAAAYVASIETDPAHALARWRGLVQAGGRTSLFQTPVWLAAWFATLGAQPGRTPLLASIARRSDAHVVMALPLIAERRGRLRRIAFADAGVADYAAPLLMPGCPQDRAGARALYAALRRALPPADLLAVEKLPAQVDGLDNPLLHWPGVRASALCGHPVEVGEDFDAWRYSREKTHRKELERSWRVFERHEQARFARIDDHAQAAQVMDALERQQRESIQAKGWAYVLDAPGYRDFYRRLLADGLDSGQTVLTALLAGEEVVAALLGLRRGADYAMVRIGHAGGAWRTCSPGRLVIERSMAALHAQGVRRFDFTIGDYAYKKGFKPQELALHDLTRALSWRGWPHSGYTALRHGLRQRLAAHPQLKARLVRMRARTAAAPPGD